MGAIDHVVAQVVHARTVPAAARERFSMRLRSEPTIRGLLLETCHRIELYVASADHGAAPAWLDALPEGGAILRGEAAVRHALSVAVGRDSVVIGEDQVLHQLRRALSAARSAGTLDPVLERLFTLALQAGRRSRSWRETPSRSLADLAVDRIRRAADGLSGRQVLVVGTGEMGRLAILSAMAGGASVSIASRSAHRASEVAQSTGAVVEAFDPAGRVGDFAAIIVALRGPWTIAAETADLLAESAALVVDLSVPSALADGLADRLRGRLTTADDFAHDHAGSTPASSRMVARLDALVDQTAAEFLAWLDGRERRAAASALVERADAEREAALRELWRRLPDLDPEARATIESMSRHLARRLLREPLERLGADADGRHERAVRELWAL